MEQRQKEREEQTATFKRLLTEEKTRELNLEERKFIVSYISSLFGDDVDYYSQPKSKSR